MPRRRSEQGPSPPACMVKVATPGFSIGSCPRGTARVYNYLGKGIECRAQCQQGHRGRPFCPAHWPPAWPDPASACSPTQDSSAASAPPSTSRRGLAWVLGWLRKLLWKPACLGGPTDTPWQPSSLGTAHSPGGLCDVRAESTWAGRQAVLDTGCSAAYLLAAPHTGDQLQHPNFLRFSGDHGAQPLPPGPLYRVTDTKQVAASCTVCGKRGPTWPSQGKQGLPLPTACQASPTDLMGSKAGRAPIAHPELEGPAH